ncbi:hypothetical protein [Sporosarcina beigongshangi]|uniref:hypothetical protein n=1 Tax=Sporosarcina beigongshangi TaxID=2782538 RepID=UPI0019396E13|nr:hypothetical protein [Sporosarcina beigongshangi]
MEKLILYVPNLEKQFNERKELQQASFISNTTSHVNYIKEERKLYMNTAVFGTLEFQVVLLDFEQNKMIFKRKKELPRDIQDELYELLTSYQLEFQPVHLSFIMHRPERTKIR